MGKHQNKFGYPIKGSRHIEVEANFFEKLVKRF